MACVPNSPLYFDGEGSTPALGLDMRVGDVVRCKACIVPVEEIVVENGIDQGLPVLRCPMCHRFRTAHRVEGRNVNAD